MRFADPQACPDCRGVIAGQPACPHCGLDLTSLDVRQLWQLLLQADELLARATHRRVQPQAPVAPPPPQEPASTPPAPPDPIAAGLPSYPVTPASSVAPRERSWSVGTVLLVLGAFGLVVAGLIFVTRSWEEIGLVGKTVILLAVTAGIGVLGVWVTRRTLRASAEAVWSVFLALLTLDFFAARREDLVGLRALDVAASWIVWGTFTVALGVGIARWARPHVGAALVAPAVAAGLGITIAGLGAGAAADDLDVAWRAVVALVAAGLLALATRPAALPPVTLVARIVVAAFFASAYVAALVEMVGHPSVEELFVDAHGIPMVLMAVASVVVAWVVPVVRLPATALAVLAVSVLAVTPFADAGPPEAVWAVVAVLAAALAAVGSHGVNDWMRGVRLGSLPVVAGIGLLHLGLLADVVETVSQVVDTSWVLPWDVRLDVVAVDNYEPWAVPIAVAGLVVTAWFVPRWPEAAVLRPHAAVVVAGAVCLGTVDAVVTLRLPVWAVPAVLLALVLVALLLHLRKVVTTAGPAALGVVVAASLLAAASHGVSAWAWLLGAVLLAVFASAPGPTIVRQVHAVVAVVIGLSGVAAVAELPDPADAVAPLVVLAAALALVATAGLWLTTHPVRVAVEVAAGVGALVPLVASGSISELVVRWTILGAVLIGLGFSVRDRRWYVWPGTASLVVAYVLLIVDSGFSFVEAYTLPLGAVALGVGAHLARTRTGLDTWTLLGPGLAISLLPSVPQALVDPTELRALLLGGGAVVVLAVGIRLGWQAPFVAGTTVVTLLVLFNIGPYANAAPRVLLIAALGAISMGLGITWEDRVRDGRKLVGYVRSMR